MSRLALLTRDLWNTGSPGQAGRRQRVCRGTIRCFANPLLPGLQLARQGEQLGRARLDDARSFRRRFGLAEIQLLDPAGALFDLVGGNQDLADVFVGLREVVLQLQYALAQAAEIVPEVEDL